MKRFFLPAHPALRLLACAVFGVLAAIAVPFSPFGWLAVAFLFCIVTGVLLLVNRTRFPAGNVPWLSVVSYLLMVFAGFAFYASATFRLVPSPSLISWVGREVIVSGIVDARPVVSHGKARLRVSAREVFDEGRTVRVDEPVKVVIRMPGDQEFGIQQGDFVHVKGSVGLIPPASNRDEFDPRWFYRLKGMHCQLFCIGPWMVRQGAQPTSFLPFGLVVNPLRNYLQSAIDQCFPEGPEQDFIKGMMLGERELVQEEVYDAFRRTGTAHVLVVSGLHVALLAYVVNLALQRLRVTPAGKWLSLFILVVVIALYCFVTGNAPSTRRAAIMVSVIIAGSTIGRKSYPLNSLAAADLIILLFNPLELMSPGFQMTNAAVVGILTIYPWFSSLIPDGDGVLRKVAHFFWSAFSVSLSAMIGIAPVIAWYFGTYAPSGIIANVLVVLFSSMAMYASFPMVLLHGLGGGVAELFGFSSWLFAHVALWFVGLFSRLPFASVEVHPDFFGLVVFYLNVALVLSAIASKAWGRLAVSVLIGLNLLLWYEVVRPVPDSPRMVTVNAGRDLALLLSSGGEALLVEDGRRPVDRDRIRRQAGLFGLADPVASVGMFSADSDEQLQPVSVGLLSASRQFVVRRPADRVLRIDSKQHAWLLVSGLKRLEQTPANEGDVVLWVGRFTEKEWSRLESWVASARPQRMLLVPGVAMPYVQRGLLERFATQNPVIEVRSKSGQTVWY
ncbi:MAG TPA: ComEC family competence protein [Chlorobaculum parvum]|uniref:ComEC family competence protein n=1 Tax=Chlorobaculum parvum TaxID=274539 RepID=A0A7C5H8R9_9CHLB|nr:ComEC family competence protein [Chlorobaculum parvum]